MAIYLKGLNQINLIDTRTTKRDKFSLKSCDKRFSRQSFVVNGLDFSPDGTRLAVGQSDCIIYIYKIGQQSQAQHNDDMSTISDKQSSCFGRPVISGRFVCSSPVTCLVWTEMGIIFGTRDGKIKLISFVGGLKQLHNNNESSSQAQQRPQTKVINLHNSPKGTMPIKLSFKPPVLAAAFVDGSIQILNIASPSSAIDHDQLSGDTTTPARRTSLHLTTSSPATSNHLTIDHCYTPSQLTLLNSNQLCCASSDGRLAFYLIGLADSGDQGKQAPSQIISLKEEIVSLDYSTTNDILAMITKNRLLFVALNSETNKWQLQTSSIEFAPSMSVPTTLTCIRWIRDGAKLVVGTQHGSLELFKCNWNKQTLNDKLDICHISNNRVRITDRERNLLATYKTGFDIKRVNLFVDDDAQRTNVLIWTTASLLMARLGLSAQSEIKWQRDKWASSGSAKFYFHPAGYVIIFSPPTCELSLVKLGQDSVCFSTRMDSQILLNKNTISLSCFPLTDDTSTLSSVGSRGKNYVSTTKRRSELSLNVVNDDDRTQTDVIDGKSSSLGEELDQVSDAGINRVKMTISVETLAYASNSAQHLQLIDLKQQSGTRRKTITKDDSRIVWLELSCTGKYLAWRNSKDRMTLLQVVDHNENNNRNEIKLDHVTFCRWIQETDILIAQSLHKIYIWYKIECLHNPKVIDSRSYNILKRAPLIDLSYINRAKTATRAYPKIISLIPSDDLSVSLSNGCSIPLDSLYVKFHKQILNFNLEAALKLLEKETTREERRVSLWTQLGWTAIKQENVEIAIRAFKEINHASMVEYLKSCSRTELDEMQWRLAKLNGDWDLFERLQDPETVVSTYKRLNKWSKCIEYLGKTQQFRQKDLAEQEHRRWLIEQGRELEAAKLLAKQTGDLRGAIQLLIDRNNHEEAGKLLLEEHKAAPSVFASDPQVLTRLKDELATRGSYYLAAKLCRTILNDASEALNLFLKGEFYDDALSLAETESVDKKQVDGIKRDFADKLLGDFRQNSASGFSKSQAARSIQLYLESGHFLEALEAAIELRQSRRALELLESKATDVENPPLAEEQICAFSEKIAHSLLQESPDQRSLAIRAFRLAKHYSKVVALSIEEKKFDEAFRVSLKFIHKDDETAAREEFKRLARQKIGQKDLDSAERLFLLVGEADSAIEMQRAAGNHERMIELVEQYQPESMERNLLLLAKQMEQEQRFDEAERFLLKAGQDEWINVVRMYRLANKWDEAYRVARQHCQSPKDPLLVQLAYFWSKSELASSSSSVEAARELLETKLNCLSEVLEFSCDNNNFAFALKLSNSSQQDSHETRRIVKKYANYLEKNEDLCGAEQLLVQHNQLEEAVRMYLDNDLYLEAVRVIEETQQQSSSSNNERRAQLVELLNGTLVEAANRISSRIDRENRGIGSLVSGSLNHETTTTSNSGYLDSNFALAQQLYLRAQRPELAIEMYKRHGLWQEAIQLAQRFAPQLLESVESELDAQVSLDLKPILNNGTSSAQQLNKMSRSSSRSSSLATTVTLNGREQEDGTGAQSAPDVADQFLKSQADRFIRRGQDPRSTRQALDKLLTNLAVGDRHNEAACLVVGEKLARLEQQQQFDRETVRKIHSMADQLFRLSCPLIAVEQSPTSAQLVSVWRQFRDSVAKILTIDNRVVGSSQDEEKSERTLLALHYVTLHKCLADEFQSSSALQTSSSPTVLGPLTAGRFRAKLDSNKHQPQQKLAATVKLLAKLSMSLLRYSDLLDERACFLSAGFWTLVAGQTCFARFCWSRLLELLDMTSADRSQSSSRLERQLKQADCPQVVAAAAAAAHSNSLVPASYESLGEIRSWLIESLLENRASLELSPLDEDGHLESSLRAGKFRPCLVSGYPLFPSSPDSGHSDRNFGGQVRQDDWKSLKMLAAESGFEFGGGNRVSVKERRKQLNLGNCAKFIERLAKLNG